MTLGDPEAPSRINTALGVGDPLPDVDALLARAHEPGVHIAGWRGASRRRQRRALYPLRCQSWAPVQRIYLQVDADDAGTLTVDATDPVPIRRGSQQVVVTLARPQRTRSIAVRSTIGVVVTMIAAVPLDPMP